MNILNRQFYNFNSWYFWIAQKLKLFKEVTINWIISIEWLASCSQLLLNLSLEIPCRVGSLDKNSTKYLNIGGTCFKILDSFLPSLHSLIPAASCYHCQFILFVLKPNCFDHIYKPLLNLRVLLYSLCTHYDAIDTILETVSRQHHWVWLAPKVVILKNCRGVHFYEN